MSGNQPSDDDDDDALWGPGDPSRFSGTKEDIEMLGPLKKIDGAMPLDKAGNTNPDVEDVDYPDDEDVAGGPPAVAGRT